MKNNLMELIYFICGFACFYIVYQTATDKKHTSKVGTIIFWLMLGIIMAFGKYIPPKAVGVLILIMSGAAMSKQVKPGNSPLAPAEYRKKMSDKLGYKIFIPAFTIGVTAIVFAIFLPKLGALVGLGIGTILAAVMVMIMTKDTPKSVMNEGRRLLDAVGPLSTLPQLLASLGAIFTAAGVGEVIAGGVQKIVPEGNVFVGIVIYAVGMVLFTMIMGNAFAAFSVITVGIGVPFVLKYGLDPNVVGMLALTCGYCGTLMTPMAANFNIVPVAILEMKDKYGVIKKQIPIAIIMLVVQILLMYFMAR